MQLQVCTNKNRFDDDHSDRCASASNVLGMPGSICQKCRKKSLATATDPARLDSRHIRQEVQS